MRGARHFRGLTAMLCAVVALLLALPAAAAPKSGLDVEARPVLGVGKPTCPGWFSVSVRLSNTSDTQITGTLELVSQLAYARDRAHIVTRAPFGVAGKGHVTLELPTHGFNGSLPPELRVRALAQDGSELANVQLRDPRPSGPFLFDLDVPSRLAPSLRGMPVVATRSTGSRYGAFPTLAVSSPRINPATGDPVLPERAAGYASATVVLAKSEQIAALEGPELRALGDWVLAGGTLAVVVSRPEDLHRPPLTTMLGGEVHSVRPPAALEAERDFLVARPSSTGSPSYGSSGRAATGHRLLSPSRETADELVGFSGGNLHPSPWGASASYGLGEVHLLAFDATRAPYVTDDWVRYEMLELVTHAFNRENTVALPYAQTALDSPGARAVKKVLDPNESSRWAIAVSALLLLLYAAGAGPLNFYRASKKGRPLRALLHLPIWAAGAFSLVVVLGIAAKGVHGRARHLTLVQAGAGMSRATATRFRGFYSASSEQLTVRATHRASVLDVAGQTDDTGRELVVDRDGARIEHFQAKPWQTVVVREDGFIDLGGGVSIVRTGHDVEVDNRMARDLIAVLVKVPGHGVVYFPRIADGRSVLVSKGKPVPGRIGHPRMTGSGMTHGLDADLFDLDKAADGVDQAWQALETVASTDTDWWPPDVPVVIGQIEGGEGRTSDSGLRLDRDRVLLRVIGYGGVK